MKQFPHKNRKLTAAFLIILFAVFIILNLAQNGFFKADEEKKLRFSLMKNPKESATHEKLGQYYLPTDEEAAKREYLLAQEYFPAGEKSEDKTVLGSKSGPWQTWQNLIVKKHNQANEISYWEKVTETSSLYLYAYLKLAQLNLEKGNTPKAKDYLETALRLDPTNQYAIELLGRIK